MANCTKQVGWSPSTPSVPASVTVAVDNGDGTGTITNPDGSVVTMATSVTVDTDTTYTFPATVGLDGVMTVTDSSGGSQTVTIEFPEDVDIASNSVVGGVVQFVDSNGDPLPGLDIDLNPYISSPHPTIVASGDATVTFDAGTNEWTIGFVDTDTFATVSGSTVTDAAGNSVTVPVGSTYNPATNEITTSDGQVVALAVDTDTNTFATQNANGDLVLADGTVVPLMVDTDTDRVNQLTLNADGSVTSQIVDIDGNPVGSPVVIPAPNDLWAYSQGTPNTIAEVAGAAGDALDAGSTNFVTTNAAVEAGAAGHRNQSGKLGHFDEVVPDLATALNNNGTYYEQFFTSGDVIDIPDGTDQGQTFRMFLRKLNSQGEYAEAILRTSAVWLGRNRNSQHEFQRAGSGAASTDVIARDGEFYKFTWVGSNWRIMLEGKPHVFSGASWWEHPDDGRITMIGNINNIQENGTNPVLYPVPITTPAVHILVSISSTQVGTWAGLDGGDIWVDPASRTTTGFSTVNSYDLGSTATAGRWQAEFGRVDYLALGAIANY